jgi:hypothetical protein
MGVELHVMGTKRHKRCYICNYRINGLFRLSPLEAELRQLKHIDIAIHELKVSYVRVPRHYPLISRHSSQVFTVYLPIHISIPKERGKVDVHG